MRFDAIGLFWEDRPKEKRVAKEKVKPVPPKPVWLDPDYLPHYEDAYYFELDLMTFEEMEQAAANKEVLIFDTESYPNYWACGFMSVQSGKYILFERDDEELDFDSRLLEWVMRNFTIVGFYSENYDLYTTRMAATGSRAGSLYWATQQMIEFGVPGWRVLQQLRHKKWKGLDHIDVYELTALHPGLKTMAGRLDSPLMMDLPFKPGTTLTPEQKLITRYYMMAADLCNTKRVYDAHAEALDLRVKFGALYDLDLRSCSNAQMTEAIFRHEYEKRTGKRFKGRGYGGFEERQFQYQMPDYIQFETENLQWLKEVLETEYFTVRESGYVSGMESIKDIKIPIGDGLYSFGIGGLHSNEHGMCHTAGSEWILRDHDVTSYYPELILKSGMEPPILEGMFRAIFQFLLDERKEAKRTAPKGVVDLGLKIVINGGFGKTSDPTSILYFPELMIQTTITGQLCLLMAIERLTLAGFQVINANTDGIVVKVEKEREKAMQAVFAKWEEDVGLKMETADYSMYFARDVNNYFAFKEGGKTKAKGVFSPRGAASEYKKNPTNEICITAVIKYITDGVPIEHTIGSCNDIAEFVSIRNVAGGAAYVDNDYVEFAGKITRWYFPKGCTGRIVTAKKGHLVPTTTGARPILTFNGFPEDLDREHYINEAYEILDEIGYSDEHTTKRKEQNESATV